MLTGTKIKLSITIAIALLTILFAIFSLGYAVGMKKYYTLLGQAKQQELQLKADYKKAQKEVEQKQKELNKIAQQQSKKDEQAKIQIKNLTNELTNQLVRVRVQPEANKCSGAGASTNKDTADSEGNRIEAYGLLPELNTKRLASAIGEIETLNAAYASCRNTLQINNK